MGSNIAIDAEVLRIANGPIEVGAHGIWTRTVRRAQEIDVAEGKEDAHHTVTTDYALWRMTHEGRARVV